jgi:DNA-binding phage protein
MPLVIEMSTDREEILSRLLEVSNEISSARGDLSGLYESRNKYLIAAYEAGYNMSEVARAAGITREAMYRVLRRNGTQFRG